MVARIFWTVIVLELSVLAATFWKSSKLPQGQSGGRDMGLLINVIYPAVFLLVVALAFWLVKSEGFRALVCMAVVALGLVFAVASAQSYLKQRNNVEAFLAQYQDPGQRKLAKAIFASDIAKVAELAPHVKMNERSGNGQPLLQLALYDETPAMEEMTLILLRSGADPNLFDTLPQAIGMQNITIVKAVLDAGGDPNRKLHPGGEVAFHGGAQYFTGGGRPVLALLLDRGARIDEADHSGKTALMVAASSGNLEALGLLIDRGANRNLKDSKGKTALDFLELKMAPPQAPYNIAELKAAAARLR